MIAQHDTTAAFDPSVVEAAKGYAGLGPAYFDARKVAERAMASFEADHLRPLVQKVAKELEEELWTHVQESLWSDIEMNLQNQMWRMVDSYVNAVLGGETWAVDRAVMGSRYDCGELRKQLAALVPVELQNARIADLEAELKQANETVALLRNRY